MEKKIDIGGELHSVATDHKVADASEIKDSSKENKSQADFNDDVDRHEVEIHGTGGIDSRLTDIEQLGQIVLNGGDAQIAQGSDFTNPNATKRAKIPTVGAILDGLNDGIYDVSKRNPTGGPNSDGKFTLDYILANADTLIPTSWRHGGMIISFAHSSDNKYVQYRLMAQNFSTAESYWQGVDDEPTAGSDNLVKSGGAEKTTSFLKSKIVSKKSNVTPTATAVLIKGNIGEAIVLESRSSFRTVDLSVQENDIYFVSLYRVSGENAYSVFLVDSNNIIVQKLIPSTYEDFGVVEDVVIEIPSDISKMYVMTYWNTTPKILEVYKGEYIQNTVQSIIKDVDNTVNVCLFGTINVAVDTGVVTTEGIFDVYYGEHFKRFTDGVELFTITKTAGTANINFNPETESFVYNRYEGILLGVTSGRYVYFNSKNVTVKYSNGINDLPTKTLTSKLELLEDNILEIPSFVTNAAYLTWKRLIEWVGSDKTFIIGSITDVHDESNDGRYKHVGYLNSLNKLFGFDLFVNMGDISPDHQNSFEEQLQILNRTKKYMDSPTPWVLVKGNHENSFDNANNYVGAIYNRELASKIADNIVFGNSGYTYGYINYPSHKLRVYFLNTTDSNTKNTGYIMTKDQVTWFAGSLQSLNDGWNAIVLTHMCMDDIGRWPEEKGTYRYGIWLALANIMSAYNTKNSGAYEEISWDFSQNTGGKIVADYCGDSHYNGFNIYNNVNYIIRQGITPPHTNTPEGCTYDEFNLNEGCLYDILAVKQDGNAKIFRIGAGGANRDLAFTY